MKQFLIFLLFSLSFSSAAQCTLEEYQALLKDAKTAQKSGQYDLAINKLFSARVCKPEKEEEIKSKVLEVFEEVNKQRKLAIKNGEELRKQRDTANFQRMIAIEERNKAERKTREVYTNNLVFKSESALRNGDRTGAFRLAELATCYIDSSSTIVKQALFSSVYCNDNYKTIPIPWSTSFNRYGGKAEPRLNGYANCVAFSPDGKSIAAGGQSLEIWDFSTKKRTLMISDFKHYIQSIAFSPDGKFLAFGSDNNTVKIWDLTAGRESNVLTGHTSLIKAVCFSPDGAFIATGSKDSTIKIWNAETGKLSRSLNYNDEILNISFSPIGNRLASSSFDDTTNIWDFTSGEILSKINNNNIVSGLTYSPDGKLLATGSNFIVKLWNPDSGKRVLNLSLNNNVTGIAFSPNNKWIATAEGLLGEINEFMVKVWDVNSGKLLVSFSADAESILSLAFSPDSKFLATGSRQGLVKIWELPPSNEAVTFSKKDGISGTAVEFSPDGKWLAMTSGDYSVRIWDWHLKKEVMSLKGHTELIQAISFSPDGKYLASGSQDGTTKIWDLLSRKNLYTFWGDTVSVNSVDFSPDGKWLATGSWNIQKKKSARTLEIWDWEAQKRMYGLKSYPDDVSQVVFSPKGTYLAIKGSGNDMVSVWDWNLDTILLKLEGYYYCVEFSADGKYLAAVNSDGVKIWDVSSMKVAGEFFDISGISKVSFSPNGKWLASSNNDNTVTLWDWRSKTKVLNFSGQRLVYNIAFSPDGKYLATSAQEVKVWDLDADHWLDFPKEKYHVSPLTATQLAAYGLESLLDFYPENENKLICTHDIWQIDAFAEFYAQKLTKTRFSKKEDYERARRLYESCLVEGVDNKYFEKKLGLLENVWQQKNQSKVNSDDKK